LGGHSLKAAGLVGRIHKAFSVEIPIAELFKIPTVKGISDYIEKTRESIYSSLTPVEEREYYPLSSAQKRLFVIHQMDPVQVHTTYNLPAVMILEGELERYRLEKTFGELISRYESLRTSFEVIDEAPVQKIHKGVEFGIDFYPDTGTKVEVKEEATHSAHLSESSRSIIKRFIRHFDLSRPPLMRVGLIKVEEKKHILMFDMHHIISDGVSMGIFTKEFTTFYKDETLPGLRLQYKDFSYWQNSLLASAEMKKQEAYWQKQFEGEIPVLNLPADYGRPSVQQFEGEWISFEIEEEMERLNQLALETGSTLYMVLFAVFSLFLSKLSSQEDIIIGTPVAGRGHPDIESIIGMFVNTLAVRTDISHQKKFQTFLVEVKENLLNAFENQDYQYEELVERVVTHRDLSRNPLFDAVFVLQNMEMQEPEAPGFQIISCEYENKTSKFDLTFQCIETGENLQCAFEYSTHLFKESTIRRFANYFKGLLSNVLADRDQALWEIEIIPGGEKKQVLFDFNNTSKEYPKDKTIHQLFEEQTARTPGNIAVVGMVHGVPGESVVSISYEALNEKSNQLAHVLREKGVSVNRIVGLMVERSMEMIIGILGILKAGGAYLPVDPEYPSGRIEFMLEDSSAHLLLTQKMFDSKAAASCKRIHLDAPGIFRGDRKNPTPPGSARDLAYVIFTSGSTGTPKGVMIEHEGISNLNTFHKGHFKVDEADKIVQFATITFDASVWEIFMALLNGAALYILNKAVASDYREFEAFLNRNQITIATLPPAYANYLNPVHLESLRLIITAGSSPTIDLVKKWKEKIDYVNAYGPTEVTICAATWGANKKIDALDVVSIGIPMDNTRIYILGNHMNIQPPGITGEMCISGVGVARGYLNRPQLTGETFIENPFEPAERLYRTGDLARWFPNGNIEFSGRIDHQVKVRGFRIELGEIENCLSNHDKINEAVVTAAGDENGEQYLCAYIAANSELPVPELRNYLSGVLPAYMIPSHYSFLEKMPLTPSGKIDRKALPAPGAKITKAYAAPGNEGEEKMAEIWASVLGVEKEMIGIDSNFFELGGHSLKTFSLVSRIHEAFNVKLPLTQVFRRPFIRGLMEYINGAAAGEERYAVVTAAEEKEYFSLSPAQKRLFIIQQMEDIGTGYNISMVVRLEGIVETERLENAFRLLLARHDSLRTSFKMIAGEPVQMVHDHVAFEMEYQKLPGTQVEVKDLDIIHHFIRPFDLSQAPLVRVGLIKLNEERHAHILVVDMHHIISDGMSIDVLAKEFMALYGGEKLPALKLRYKDYSEWRNRMKQKAMLAAQEAFWKERFAGEIPVLDLPVDYVRPTVQSFEGRTIHFEIDEGRTDGLKTVALEEGVTLYMVLLTVTTIFLSGISSQEDIIIGTPVAGRGQADLDPIIGMFVNTLALRNHPRGEKTLKEFLKEIKKNTLAAFENQDYPFEDLVEQVNINRDTGRNPLFDTMFVMQNPDISNVEIPGLKLMACPSETNRSKFDLTIIGHESKGKLLFGFEYCTTLFKEAAVERFVKYFKRIVSAVPGSAERKISDFEIISGEEKKQVLFDFNDTSRAYPKDKTIVQLFEEQAARTGDNIAVMCMAHGAWSTEGRDGIGTISITYRELNEKSDQLAALLIKKGVVSGDIVGIMGERSMEMVVGILGILKAGGVYLPIDADYPEQRKQYMLADSSANVFITAGSIPESISGGVHIGSQWDEWPIYCIRETKMGMRHFSTEGKQYGRDKSHPYMIDAGSSAYIMYTSGSTGEPKGVMVTHRNVVRLVKNTNYVELGEETRILQTGAPVFDATTFEIWGALLNGGQLVLTGKEVILDAHQLAGALEVNRINTLWLSSPLFNQLVQQSIALFSPLRYLLVGGDVLYPIHINRVKHRFPGLKIINGYGPTENTTFSTTYLIEEAFEQNIPIGSPIANSTAYIVNSHNQLQPIGVWGELIVGGDGVSCGYLNSPEMTADRFKEKKKGTGKYSDKYSDKYSFLTHPLTHSPIYKTGDLARWLPDGNIEFSGRIDQQVKVRGFRVELGEIEDCLLKWDEIKEAVVIAVPDEKGDKSLCAYIVSESDIPVSRLRDYLSNQLPGYMIPSYFTWLEKIPLNPNGKIDRKALPAPEARVTEAYAAPRNEVEEKLAEIWSSVLGVKKETIGIDSNFFELGGHSLKATILVSRIHEAFNVKLPLTRVFQSPVIRRLGESIKEASKEAFISIDSSEKKDFYRLSSAQKRLYVLQQLDLESTGYNMPVVVALEGHLAEARLEEVFNRLITRHDSLRTSFMLMTTMTGEVPVQRIHDDVDFMIEYYDLTAKTREDTRRKGENFHSNPSASQQIHHFVRPFDLSQAPLLRVGSIKIEEQRHILMVDMHHIISDGTSMSVFVNEFMSLYAGDELPPSRIQYNDFSERQNSNKERESIKAQEAYWLKEFEGEIPVLVLPTDYARPAIQGFEGSTIPFEIGSEDTRRLRRCALNEGVTLYMLLLAIYNIFLSKISGQEEIVVGTPLAGRRHAELQQIIGMFVNTLALKNSLPGGEPFIEFVRKIKEKTLESFGNQDYQYEELVEKVAVNRDASRNPLFDVMFVLQNVDVSEVEIPGLKLLPYHYEWNTSKFDLSLHGFESEETLSFIFEYSTKLFKRETVERFISYFKKTAAAVENIHQRLSDIEILPGSEKNTLLNALNNTRAPYPEDKTIHELFEKQVEKRSNHIVLIDEGNHFTYGELNGKSNRLARLLREKGITTDTIIGIMIEPSIEMVTGIIGILKSGGAYLPLDTGSPEARNRFILKDSSVRVLLVTKKTVNKIECEAETIDLEEKAIYRCEPSNLNKTSRPGNLAYVIYTSGTTGHPKGALIEHRNVVQLMVNDNYLFDFNSSDVWTLFHSYCFDFSVWEMYGALLYGGKLVLIPRMTARDPRLFLGILKKESVTILNQTPAAFYNLANQEIKSSGKTLHLKYVIFGGEALKPAKLKQWEEKYPETKLINMFGITETTVHVTYKEIKNRDIELNISNIGRPIPTLNGYVVDRCLKLAPPGTAGEICVGGEGVGRGYLNRSLLTGEKFVDNPYIPGEKFYRSGDLGKLSVHGEIEYLGRIDHQVKVRGFRVELGEIENQLLKKDEIKEVVVLPGENERGNRDTYLSAYIVSDREFPGSELRDFLLKAVPEYMVPTYFVPIDKIPLTSNGKVNRNALPDPGTGGKGGLGEKYAAPRSEIEKKLAKIWEEELGVRPIGIYDNFFTIGGHSLKAIGVVNHICKIFGVEIGIQNLFQFPTIASVAHLIQKSEVTGFKAIKNLPKQTYYELSYSQKRLWYITKKEPHNPLFNMPVKMTLYEANDEMETIVRKVLGQLTARHESLRTFFKEINKEPVQVIEPITDFTLNLEVFDWTALDETERGNRRSRLLVEESSFIFNLEAPPLFRVKLVKCREVEYDLVFNMHHIISDGWSLEILKQEFNRVYDAYKEGKTCETEPLKLQYKEYAAWQNQLLADKEQIGKATEFWKNYLRGTFPVLHLPYDFSPGLPVSKESAAYRFVIPEALTNRLREMAVARQASVFMVLLAGFNLLFYQVTGQEDIMMAIPAAARQHEALKNIIGMFVNTLILRNHTHHDEPFLDFFKRFQDNTFKVLEYQGIPMELIFGQLKIKYPEISVFFNMVNIGRTHQEEITDGESYHIANVQNAKFDIVCYLTEYKNGIEINCHYFKERFKPVTIKKLMDLYCRVLDNISGEPTKTMGEYSLAGKKKKRRLKRK
jgi:amino acid adenylation domain-containing protein